MDEVKNKILARLQECREAYQEELSQEEAFLLLENTMCALQDLLFLE
jgi:hypothetical protein